LLPVKFSAVIAMAVAIAVVEKLTGGWRCMQKGEL
jgi:hypothetical protein